MSGTETLAAGFGGELVRLLWHLLPDWLKIALAALGLTCLVVAGARRLWRVVRASRPAS
ncbi:hypothetical protein [Streptomyces sp. NPDC054975]